MSNNESNKVDLKIDLKKCGNNETYDDIYDDIYDETYDYSYVNTPYSMKLLLQEIESFGIKPTVYTNDKNIVVTTTGRYFVRHICRLFDTILDSTMLYQPHGT